MCYMLEYGACQADGVCGLVGWVGVRFDICSCNRIYPKQLNICDITTKNMAAPYCNVFCDYFYI
jgi:hypothetical protein